MRRAPQAANAFATLRNELRAGRIGRLESAVARRRDRQPIA